MADSILRLKVESQEYDAKLKRASQGLQQYADGCRKVGVTLEVVEKETLEFVKAIGRMETTAKSAKGGLAEMKNAFTELSVQYKRLTDAEKQSPYGRALSQSLEQLKGRINESRKELNEIGKSLGSGTSGFSGALDALGSKLGINSELMGVLTTGTIGYTAAITAGAGAVAYATQKWAEYNAELAKQQQITSVTTGLKGDDADKMTAAARAVSKVYGTDFREVINAANTLMSQFGETGDEAMRIIKDGMQGMIQGDGPKLLSMIQQYAPAFRDAGISASQLVAVIQNSEGGIFTDQNMNAIVMGIKNIRLMTNATSEALAKVGIDGQKMSQDLSNGTLTIFDALKQVAGAIKNTESGSQDAGMVMQQVFGRQGAMAGTKLGEAIDGLNINLDEMKLKTGDVGESMKRLTDQTESFEKKLMEVFGFDGWDTMSNDIKTGVLMSLTETLSTLGEIFKMLNGIAGIDMNATDTAKFFTDLATFAYKALNPVMGVLEALSALNKLMGGSGSGQKDIPLTDEEKKINMLASVPGYDDESNDVIITYNRTKKTPKGGRGSGGGSKTVLSEEQQNVKTIKELSEAYEKASEERRKAIEAEIKKLQERNAEIKYYKDLALGNKVRPMGADVMEGQGIGLGTVNQGISNLLKEKIDPTEIVTPLERLNEELKKLIELRDNAFSAEGWQTGNVLVEQKQKEIANYKGESKKQQDPLSKSSKDFSQILGSVNSISSGIQSIGVEIPEEIQNAMSVMSGILSVVQGISSILLVIEALDKAQTATSFIPFFSHGGIVPRAANGYLVPGNSYSGDNTLIAANAGELVLNASQQRMVAQNLQDNGGGMHVVGEIQGEKIVLVANRFLRRSGQGELVTWK